ncbi:MAG: leucine-rich repeat domain-containing protein [Clostridium sp.]|nr:leucine-rich repeat domain-containing protein [Clostridium sp.]
MNIRTAIAGILLTAGLAGFAHDFSATIDGQRIYFDITSKTKRTAAVTYNGSISEKRENNIAGKVEIPSKVKHDNVVYEITAINPKAFANARHLRGIVIPSGVESIGDFAFEGCDSLESVVFPGNPVSFGQGVFFNCPEISDVTIGSDWKSVDFTMFRWSDRLTRVSVPAKVEKIQGVKKLKGLTEITVDPNNRKFASFDGMLYSKDGKKLYACPRGYAGIVRIKEGTETVTPGALIDCLEVTYIDFPSTLKSVSFRETSRMEKLATIVMSPAVPPVTAYIGGQGKFLLQVANAKVAIVVLSSSKKSYESEMAVAPGEYSETPTGVPYMVTAGQIPTKKNIKGVKNFEKI